jgi:hypothetical protein
MSSIGPLNSGHPLPDDLGSEDDTPSSLLGREPSRSMKRAQEALRRDLPELLKNYPRRWVAYTGDWMIAVGRSRRNLDELCLSRGLSDDDFVVLSIEPEVPDEEEWE